MMDHLPMRPAPLFWQLSLFVGLALVCVPLLAASTERNWSLCPATFGPPPLVGFIKDTGPADEATHIRSDTASGDQQSSFSMQGNVRLQRGKVLLRADEVEYDRDTDSVSAHGNVNYQYGGVRFKSEQAEFDLGHQSGAIAASQYWLPQRHLRGQADAIIIDSKDLLHLQGASITSCNDGNSDWLLRASELKLDQANNEGVAWHARLEFMRVPVFYFPYLSFPISGRKSGLLVPDITSSTVSGTIIGLPYYWNIAPDRDATFTPYYYSKRGSQLQTEFRYLNRASSGQLDLAYLPNDSIFGDDRKYARLQHQAQPGPGWRYSMDGQFVSDDQYFTDFGSQLSIASQTLLERRFDVRYQGSQWRVDGLLQNYQTLDQTIAELDRPYQRLPQILVNSTTITTNSDLNLDFSAEMVRFYRDTGVTATRVDLQPRLNWPYRRAAGFVTPALTLRHTRYHLERNLAGSDASPSRSLPQFSVDSGLFFERDVSLKQRSLLQTLEPRLYYLYVPYRDQSQLVLDEAGNARTFDSGLPLLSFDELFRNNRFTGADRVGDANQLTLAVTSRLLSPQGREMLSGSLGQIVYFRDRRVTLPGSPVETLSQSDRVAELRSQWNPHIDTSASLLWDTQNNRNARGALKFRYLQDQDRIAELSYRYERDAIKQSDVSLLWTLARRWKMVGRWYYSWFDDVALERLLGVEYESCCWALRLVSRNYISSLDDSDHNNTIWLQLELKGLASVGKKVNELFDTGRLD